MDNRVSGAIVSAWCDLTASVSNFTKRPIRKRYLRTRRADTFDVLERHYWDRM